MKDLVFWKALPATVRTFRHCFILVFRSTLVTKYRLTCSFETDVVKSSDNSSSCIYCVKMFPVASYIDCTDVMYMHPLGASKYGGSGAIFHRQETFQHPYHQKRLSGCPNFVSAHVFTVAILLIPFFLSAPSLYDAKMKLEDT